MVGGGVCDDSNGRCAGGWLRFGRPDGVDEIVAANALIGAAVAVVGVASHGWPRQ